MGAAVTKAIGSISGQSHVRAVMMGMENSGKTTMLYKIKLNEVVTTIPTIGFGVEMMEWKNLSIHVIDVGGDDKIRPLWRHLFENTQAVIWVIDSTDKHKIECECIDETHQTTTSELHETMNEDLLQDVVLLVFANKYDLTHTMELVEIVDKLKLDTIRQRWCVYASSSLSSNKEDSNTYQKGIYEGLKWLSNTVNGKAYVSDINNECKTWISCDNCQVLLANRRKSILLVCGITRNIDSKYKWKTPVSLTKLIHLFYTGIHYDNMSSTPYAFYG
eukprot:4295_1